jgi:hypothetical protein
MKKNDKEYLVNALNRYIAGKAPISAYEITQIKKIITEINK